MGMTSECIDVERIADVLELSEQDPLRHHVDQCPRCSSLLATYRVFIKAEATAGADTSDAEARLMDYLQARIGAVAPAPPAPDTTPDDGGFFARLKGAVVLRPAWVAAALVVIAAAVMWWRPWVAEQPALRSKAESPLLEILAPETLSNGSVRIDWHVYEGADKYEIVLYNNNLEEIARFEAGPATFYDMSREELPPGAPAVVICRVAAFKDGDEVAQTAPVALEFP